MRTVESKEQVLALLRKHHEELRRYGVKRCGLFGSFTRGVQNNESDVDIIVEFEEGKKSFDNFMHVAFFLESLFGRRVDLLTPESLSPYLAPRILREVEYVPSSDSFTIISEWTMKSSGMW